MATYYSQGDGAWSTLTNWDTVRGGGGSDPASTEAMDDQTFVIQPNHNVYVDFDMSGFANGINGLTIEGHASTPGRLYFKADADGTYWLKMKTGTNIAGTSATAFGRLMMGGGTWGSPAAPGTGRKQVIEFAGTGAGKIAGQYLAGQLLCDEPTNKYVTPYGGTGSTLTSKISVTVDYTAAREFTLASGTLANGNIIQFTGTALPTGLYADRQYYVVNYSSGSFSVAPYTSLTKVTITSNGTSVSVFTGCASGVGSTEAFNVLEDVNTSDVLWAAGTTDFNYCVLADQGPNPEDVQILTLSAKSASTVTVSANTDSAQYPGARLYLMSRNVQILSRTTSGSALIIDLTSFTASATNNWSIAVAVIPTASSTATRVGCCIHPGTSVPGTAVVTISGGTTMGASKGITAGSYPLVSGGVHAGHVTAFHSCVGATISGGIFAGASYGIFSNAPTEISGGTWEGIGSVVHALSNYIISGGTFRGCYYVNNSGTGGWKVSGGTFYGNSYAMSGGNGILVTGGTFWGNGTAIQAGGHFAVATLIGNNYGLSTCTGTVGNISCSGNGADIYTAGQLLRGFGATLGSTIQCNNYLHASVATGGTALVQINDLAGYAGDIGAWSPGGSIKTNAGHTKHVMTAQDSDADVWMRVPFLAKSGKEVSITVVAQLGTTSGWTDLPTWAIVDPTQPWKGVSELLDSETQANDTSEHTYTLTYTPDHDRELWFMARAKGGNSGGTGTGTCDFSFTITPTPATTGGGTRCYVGGV